MGRGRIYGLKGRKETRRKVSSEGRRRDERRSVGARTSQNAPKQSFRSSIESFPSWRRKVEIMQSQRCRVEGGFSFVGLRDELVFLLLVVFLLGLR